MISFRFHVIALASVSLALGAGFVFGDLARHGPAPQPVQDRLSSLDQDNQHLRAQLAQLAGSAKGRDDLAGQLAPAVLERRLVGVSVLVLSTAAAQPYLAGVSRMLTLAGATESGEVRITDAFADPSRAQELLDLATASLPPSVTAGLPETTDGVAASSALLAQVLVKHAPPVTDDDRRSVLSAYTSEGFVVASRPVTGPADAVLFVTGAAPTGADAAGRTAALVSLATAMRGIGPTVVGADGAGPTVVGRIRADARLAANVSTVDNIGAAVGQLISVWALVDEIGGRFGQFGDGPGATALPPFVPLPAPSSGPDPTPDPPASPGTAG